MDTVFPSVIFKGTDILNLEVVNEVPVSSVFSDPAIVSVSYTPAPAPAPRNTPTPSSSFSTTTASSAQASVQPITSSTPFSKQTSYAQATIRPQTGGNVGYAKAPPTAGAIPSHTASSTNRFNRNNDYSTNNNQRGHSHRGGNTGGYGHHRGGHHHHQGGGGGGGGGSRFTGSGESLKGIREFGNRGTFGQPENTTGDFDMEAANERMAAETAKLLQTSNVQTVVHDNESTEIKPALAAAAYNKASSFFDTLNSTGGGLRRDEEKRLNQETFGSVGLSHFTRGRGGRGGYHRGSGRGGRGGYYNN